MDFHTDAMIPVLIRMGHEPIRLNSDFIPLDTKITYRNNGVSWNADINMLSNKRSIEFDAIKSIWLRRPGEFFLPAGLEKQEAEFIRLEIRATLSGLWNSSDCYWISHPDDIRRAGWKIEQLNRAQKLGFQVPKTLISNSVDDIRNFYSLNDGKVIYKVLSDPFLAANKVSSNPHKMPDNIQLIYTTKISDKHLIELGDSQLAPCLFQEEIEKKLELRVTIIGDEIFVAEIHSQTNETTKLDWRHYDVDIPYKKGKLPLDLEEKCFEFVRSYNLNFSALDFILTPKGKYIFIENNPNGQFMFIEAKVPELRMTEALAHYLVKGRNT